MAASSSAYSPLFPISRQFPRRRRPKSASIRHHLSDDFLSHLPLTALGFASGLALSLPKLNLNFTPTRRSQSPVLFTSPTPFNRFVLLRCPSISLDDPVDGKEERHYVRVPDQFDHRRRGRDDEVVEYSRVCVGTDDGGVIALDWPADLELSGEHGLDSTVLLVPGSAEGSMAGNVRDCVSQCLNRGLFPVVMNPRGCAGSPLTTPRLITAADSDDVSSAMQFLSRTRPWSTFMAVGWGFGANMLTKYLAEVGQKTPLTAATCIDNPFDLEEISRASDSGAAVNQKLTGGLIDILKSNKGLFQGKSKGFDVESALSAKSVREFDTAISMISHGFETIEEFYSKSSTRSTVGNIKVPVLFIQSDDGSVPLYSIPRGDIAENPFTSLLLCSSLQSNIASSGSVIVWSQKLTIEWLMAVELALLKGRHPLLTDVEVTINPSKGMAITEGWISDSVGEHDNGISLGELDGSNGYPLKPMKSMLQPNNNSGIQLARKGTYELQEGDYSQVNDVLPQNGSVNEELDKQESADVVEGDRGQALQAAKVVMNMLDGTMPGALKEEDKKKVLTAVEKGETLVTALEDAVPEDVRGKLSTSVSEILHSQGKNLNFDALNIGKIANMSSESKKKIDGILQRTYGDESGEGNIHSSETTSSPNDSSDGSSDNTAAVDKSSGESDDTVLSQEKSVKSFHSDDSQLTNNESSARKGMDELQNKNDSNGSTVEGNSPLPHSDDDGHGASTTSTSQWEKPTGSEEVMTKQDNMGKDGEKGEWDAKENNEVKHPDTSKDKSNISTMDGHAPLPHSDDDGHGASTTSTSQCENPPGSEEVMIKQDNMAKDGEIGEGDAKENNEVKPPDSSKDESKTGEPTNESEGGLQSHQNSPDSQPSENQESETKNTDERNMPVNLDQNKSSDTEASTFNVSQALDALTGLDDSTQVAVTSVFGVIEDMITQLEERKEDDKTEDEGNEFSGNHQHTVLEDDNNDVESAKDGNDPEEVRSSLNIVSVDKNRNHSGLQSNTSGVSDEGMDQRSDKLVANKPVLKYPNKLAKINDLYLLMATKAHAEAIPNDYLQKFIRSKIKRGDKHMDLDTTTSLFFDYIPEEGHWKLLEPPGNDMNAAGHSEASKDVRKNNNLCSSVAKGTNKLLPRSSRLDDLAQLIKNTVLDSLNVEVSRKLIGADAEEMDAMLARDMEEVANSVAFAVRHDTEHNWCLNSDIDCTLHQGSGLDGSHIVETISSAVKSTNHLRKIVPVGVVVGSCLASLRKFYNLALIRPGHQSEALKLDEVDVESMKPKSQLVAREVAEVPAPEGDGCFLGEKTIPSVDSKPTIIDTPHKNGDKIAGAKGLSRDTVMAGAVTAADLSRDTVMAGAVTAALGASALLQQHMDETPSKSLEKMKHRMNSQTASSEEATDDKHQNIVVSLAEKAMSAAAPVVPTKEDGEVDQERLVSLLTGLGQKGGMLKLVGKLALLWGGIRGAMSLIKRLIPFLRIAERPLYQRILAFGGMVLILWSPLVVPFLPTLVQNWATKTPSLFAVLSCTFGLYIAIAVVIVLWGKGIRGYENPLQQYGLNLTASEKVQDLSIGLIGGIMLVLSIHSVNALLGFVDLSLPSSFSSSSVNFTIKFQSWLKLVFLAGQGLVTAISIACVEELFFRSWLAEEIAIDLGDHRGIILSGLASSICQSSLQAIPGLWLLSLCLSGARQRKQGSLYCSIGLHAGIMASCFVLQRGGFLIHRPNLPLWMTGTHPFQPFSGIVGLGFCLLLALVLYPRESGLDKEMPATIQE